QFFEFQESWMILQQVSDHQPAIETFCERHQFFGLLKPQGKWLSEKNVLSRLKGCFCKTVMQDSGRGDRDGSNRWIREHILEARLRAAMSGTECLRSRPILINDCCQRLECREVSHDVLAPIAGADNGNPWADRFNGMRRRRGKLQNRHGMGAFCQFHFCTASALGFHHLLALQATSLAYVSRVDDEPRPID